MGRRTDVGVLSIYITGDSSDFQHALKKSGQSALAFKAKIQGSMNTIGSSVTEMSHKISLGVEAVTTGFQLAEAAGLAFNMMTEGTASSAQKLEQALFKLPLGLGSLAQAWSSLLRSTGLFRAELEELTTSELRHIEAMGQLETSMRERLAVEEGTEKLFLELEILEEPGERARITRVFEAARDEVMELQEEAQKDLNKLKNEMRAAWGRDWREGGGEWSQEYRDLAQRINEAERLSEALAVQRQTHQDIRDIQLDALDTAEREAKLAEQKAQAEKMASDFISEGVSRAKKALSLGEKMAKQVKKVQEMKGQQLTGATVTISTALGAIKMADEAQTIAIQRKHLEATQEEVKILNDIRRELYQTVGVLR